MALQMLLGWGGQAVGWDPASRSPAQYYDQCGIKAALRVSLASGPRRPASSPAPFSILTGSYTDQGSRLLASAQTQWVFHPFLVAEDGAMLPAWLDQDYKFGTICNVPASSQNPQGWV